MATGMQGLAPLSAQLLQKLEQQQQQPSSLHDDDAAARHVSMNATWSGVSEGPYAAALAGAARPRSVHEILASARQTVGAVGAQKPSHGRAPLQPHKQPARLSPVQQQAGAKQPRVPSREAAGSSPPDNETLDAFVQRADKTALQGVQEKAQRRAQRLVGQRDPRHGTRRRPAAAALDAAAATQTQMAAKVQARLQERVVTELRKIQKLCPCDAKENSGPAPATSGGNGQAPDDVAFLESTLRTLRQHHRQLSEHLRTQQAAPRPAKKAQAAVVQPDPPPEQPRAAEPAAARRAKPDNSAGARAARLAARHSAAARIQHRFRLRASVRAVTRACEGRLRSMQLELSEARLQRDEAEMRQQVQQEQQEQEQEQEHEHEHEQDVREQEEERAAVPFSRSAMIHGPLPAPCPQPCELPK